jgi:hypothetical protein
VQRTVRALIVLSVLASIAGSPVTADAGTTTTYQLTVTKAGNGAGTITSDVVPGIDCGATCTASFDAGTTVTLHAAVKPNSTFEGWAGACTGTADCVVTMNAAASVTASFSLIHRPDAWIKLCGAYHNCSYGPPPPHPYHGNDVYNSSGLGQKVQGPMEEGTDIRFWVLIQNDGTASDDIYLKTCTDTKTFKVRAVLLGAHTQPDWHDYILITDQAKKGTQHFHFQPNSVKHTEVVTIDIWETADIDRLKVSCPITVWSGASPTIRDTVVGKILTI